MSEERGESEDLRRRVDELEATVRGLTQELVEANERIRQLEDRLDEGPEPEMIEAGTEASEEGSATTDEVADPNAGVAPETEAETDETEGDDDELDDIIVA